MKEQIFSRAASAFIACTLGMLISKEVSATVMSRPQNCEILLSKGERVEAYLDHVFSFVEPGSTFLQRLREAGFHVEMQRRHPGQGSENFLLWLDNIYLEWIWVSNPEEARSNALRLDLRDPEYSIKENTSPFGVAVRARAKELLRSEEYFLYTPSYFENVQIAVRKEASVDREEFPFFFAIDYAGSPLEEASAKRLKELHPNLFDHKNGATKVLSIELTGPNYIENFSANLKRVKVSNDSMHRMIIKTDGHYSPIAVTDSVTLMPEQI